MVLHEISVWFNQKKTNKNPLTKSIKLSQIASTPKKKKLTKTLSSSFLFQISCKHRNIFVKTISLRNPF